MHVLTLIDNSLCLFISLILFTSSVYFAVFNTDTIVQRRNIFKMNSLNEIMTKMGGEVIKILFHSIQLKLQQ